MSTFPPIETHEEYAEKLAEIIALVDMYPDEEPDTERGGLMIALACCVEEYEKKHFMLD